MNKQTDLQNLSSQAWRWNVNPAWTQFSTMIQESSMFMTATTEYERHRASKSCLYFGVAAVEAFKNQELRFHLEKENLPEEEIYKIVSGGYNQKKKWMKESSFGIIENDPKYEEFMFFKEIRNEVTHPSRKDQLIYDYLNITNPQQFIDIVKYIFVKICEYQGKEFQYWMLGWNYIGFNFNALEPFLGNNGNGFYHSLNAMRIDGYSSIGYDDFSNKYLRSYDSFRNLQKSLDSHPFDIEPLHTVFTQKPRLTRKWWNKKIISNDNWDSYIDDPKIKGNKLGWLVIDVAKNESLGFFSDIEKANFASNSENIETKIVYASCNIDTLKVTSIDNRSNN